MYLLAKALAYSLFYAGLVYLPLRIVVAVACKYQIRQARRRAELRKASRPRAAY